MHNGLYPKLAAQNISKNRRFFLPYLLALAGLTAAFYVMSALVFDPGVYSMRGYAYVQAMMSIGMVVAGLFSAVLLLYINSFLMKQRKKELGLYNILGMGKGNIALIQCWESLYTALVGILGGLVLGVLLHWAATAALTGLLRFSIPFSAGLSLPAVLLTAAVFGALLVLSLVLNLVRVRLSNPIQLLRGGDVGEREPKTRWLLVLIGVLALGGGYAIAILTTDPVAAIGFYFIAVLLVIIGTYCLFTAVSIAVLKLLRKNKGFYYKTAHFIGVSGMLYRMKRNAVGLANICILSTMVMVMISGTLSLYLGTGQIIEAQYPASFQVEARYDEAGETPFNGQALSELTQRFAEEQGLSVTDARTARYLSFDATVNQATGRLEVNGGGDRTTRRTVYLLTGADYQALTGRAAPALSPGQAAVCGALPQELGDTLVFQAIGQREDGSKGEVGTPLTLSVTQFVPEVSFFASTFDIFAPVCLLVSGDEVLHDFYSLQLPVSHRDYRFLSLLSLDCTTEEELALSDAWWDMADEEGAFAGVGSWTYMNVSVRAEAEVEGYSMAGGFLFLGILLGTVFLMATALIIYYKQLSEGYEDRDRFEIMRKVGLSQGEVKSSIRSQVLMVFFLPIAVAAVHILFDFNLVVRLLSLFSLRNVATTVLCTGGTLLFFFLVYGLVYLLTARTYYKIVR